MIDIHKASGKTFPIKGTIRLAVNVGNSDEIVTFYVAEKLVTPVLLGCNYFYSHVEAILPRNLIAEINDGSSVNIIRKANRAPPVDIRMPDDRRREVASPRSFSPHDLFPNQNIATAEEHPKNLIKSHISH